MIRHWESKHVCHAQRVTRESFLSVLPKVGCHLHDKDGASLLDERLSHVGKKSSVCASVSRSSFSQLIIIYSNRHGLLLSLLVLKSKPAIAGT